MSVGQSCPLYLGQVYPQFVRIVQYRAALPGVQQIAPAPVFHIKGETMFGDQPLRRGIFHQNGDLHVASSFTWANCVTSLIQARERRRVRPRTNLIKCSDIMPA